MKQDWEQIEEDILTPGGDPAWRCPVCKGSFHVYGIETPESKSNKCSNCNTDLKYPWEKE